MFPEHGRWWTRWAKIPCQFPLALSAFICKSPPNSNHRDIIVSNKRTGQDNVPKWQISSIIDRYSNLMKGNVSCPSGWTFVENLCIGMFSSLKLRHQMKWSNAEVLCKSKGAEMFKLTDNTHWFPALISLLKRWKHDPLYGQIWISLNKTKSPLNLPGITICPALEVYKNADGHMNLSLIQYPCSSDLPPAYGVYGKTYIYPRASVKVSPILPKPWNVLCQKDSFQPEQQMCKTFHFKCNDGVCISIDCVCDGVADCQAGEDEQNCVCGFGFFKCDGKCITVNKYCNFEVDCHDGSDEKNCIFPDCPKSEFQCKNKECISIEKRCNFIADCFDGTDESVCDWDKECLQGSNVSYGGDLYGILGLNTITIGKGMRCYSGECLPASKFRDLTTDCGGPSAEDEALTISDIVPGKLKMNTQSLDGSGFLLEYFTYEPFCQSADCVRCSPSHTKCFKRYQACVYDHSQFGDVVSCRNFEHLKDCKEHKCPGMFKCPYSYCIPHRKLCDGVWDCIDGFDEKNCKNFTCPGFFRCKGEKRCLDQFEVCDGVPHCSNTNDDEKYCHYVKYPCPRNCTCFGYAIKCPMSKYIQLPSISNQTRTLDMSHNKLHITPNLFSNLSYLIRLNISNNGISKLENGSFLYLYNLIELDLSNNGISQLVNGTFLHLGNVHQLYLNGNHITHIFPGAFIGLNKLKVLDLSSQRLAILKDGTFVGLISLSNLDLSMNSIYKIEENSFLGLSRLHRLYINGNQIRTISEKSLSFTNLDYLKTDAYKFCCFSNATMCLPGPDEFSSCDDLLANKTLQISIWGLGLMALLGNLAVISLRCVKEKSSPNSKLITNLGISDCLMGVYLLIIATVDQLYRGVYIIYEEEWRKSILCRFAGMIAMLSSEMSIFTMVVITLDRVRAIVFPFRLDNLSLTQKSSLILCVCGWSVCLVLSTVPMFDVFYFDSFYGQTGVCLPFTLKNVKNQGWEYAMFIFIVINGIAFIMIIMGYLMIYYSINSSRQASGRSFSDVDVRLVKKITLIIISDCLCWLPIIILSIMALNGVFIPAVVSAWVAVFILPLNSAINPFLYTFSTIKMECTKKEETKSETRSSKI